MNNRRPSSPDRLTKASNYGCLYLANWKRAIGGYCIFLDRKKRATRIERRSSSGRPMRFTAKWPRGSKRALQWAWPSVYYLLQCTTALYYAGFRQSYFSKPDASATGERQPEGDGTGKASGTRSRVFSGRLPSLRIWLFDNLVSHNVTRESVLAVEDGSRSGRPPKAVRPCFLFWKGKVLCEA